MAVEVERKYLVSSQDWPRNVQPQFIRQGYLFNGETHAIRVRTCGEQAYITIKGAIVGITRLEYEYEIPYADAIVLLDALCRRPFIEKNRHKIDVYGFEWVIDVFEGDNEGLVIAELELDSEDQAVAMPPWVGAEVTKDSRYYNANLARRPFATWSDEERAAHYHFSVCRPVQNE